MFEKIAWAVLLGVMALLIFPRARQMLKEGREGDAQDWMSALIPLVLVALFVVMLVMIV